VITYILDPNNLVTISQVVPTYLQNPSVCPFTPLYTIKSIATDACVAWLTCNPMTDFVIGTMDHTLAGTYNFRVDLADSSSDVTDSSVTFTVII
jgi:hypothetical protein